MKLVFIEPTNRTKRPGYIPIYRTYADPNYVIDDYGNLLNHWDRAWEEPTPYFLAAAYYFKYEQTALWNT